MALTSLLAGCAHQHHSPPASTSDPVVETGPRTEKEIIAVARERFEGKNPAPKEGERWTYVAKWQGTHWEVLVCWSKRPVPEPSKEAYVRSVDGFDLRFGTLYLDARGRVIKWESVN